MNHHTVLGASGVIGSRLVEYLRQNGQNVNAIGRCGNIDYRANLGHVYYCIGITADFRTRLHETVRAHVSLLQEILERAQFDSLMYLSSTRLYQNNCTTQEYDDISVNPTNSDDLYNISKIMGESLCLVAANPRVRVVRLSNVITSYNISSPLNFFDDILSSILRSKHLKLNSDLRSEKDYIDIDDVVDLMARIAQEGTCRIYNIARGENTALATLLDALRQCLDFDIAVEVAPNSPTVKFPSINTSRITGEWGFVPKPIFKTIQERIVAALQVGEK